MEDLFGVMLPGRDSYLRLKDQDHLHPLRQPFGTWAACYETNENDVRRRKYPVWFFHELGYHEDFYFDYRRKPGGDITKTQWSLLLRLMQSICQLEHDLRLCLWDPHCEVLPPTKAVRVRLEFWEKAFDSGEVTWRWALGRYLFYPDNPGKRLLKARLKTRLRIEQAAACEGRTLH